MTARPATLEAALAEVLIRHQRIPLADGTQGQRCVGCDHLIGATDGPNSPRHAAHVAAVLSDTVREWETGRVEAVEDALDDLTAMRPHIPPSTAPDRRDCIVMRDTLNRAIRKVRAALHGTEAGEHQ